MSKNDITVLLVEDELTLAMIIKDTLEENGFTIHTASDGEEGLHLFFELRPDVLVADVMMPKMDGFEMVTPHPADGQADTCTVSDCPFGHQRCSRRIRTRSKRLSEKAFRHAGTDHTYQGADGKSVQLHGDKGYQPF